MTEKRVKVQKEMGGCVECALYGERGRGQRRGSKQERLGREELGQAEERGRGQRGDEEGHVKEAEGVRDEIGGGQTKEGIKRESGLSKKRGGSSERRINTKHSPIQNR